MKVFFSFAAGSFVTVVTGYLLVIWYLNKNNPM